jgi:hypothetical protein
VAARYGATRPRASDTFFPERITRHTFQVFGPLALLGLILTAVRALF